MVINDLGHEAISLTGSQAGIVTDSGHTKARILEVKAHRIREALDKGRSCWWRAFRACRSSRST